MPTRKMSVHSGVTDGGRGASRHSGKLSVKTGPPVADFLIFSILLVFSRLFYLASIDIHNIRIHYNFLTFFLSVG